MTIDDERPEDEIDSARISEYLVVARLIGDDAARHVDNEGVARGTIACPICLTGSIAYELRPRNTRRLHAVCNTAGCIRFTT